MISIPVYSNRFGQSNWAHYPIRYINLNATFSVNLHSHKSSGSIQTSDCRPTVRADKYPVSQLSQNTYTLKVLEIVPTYSVVVLQRTPLIVQSLRRRLVRTSNIRSRKLHARTTMPRSSKRGAIDRKRAEKSRVSCTKDIPTPTRAVSFSRPR